MYGKQIKQSLRGKLLTLSWGRALFRWRNNWRERSAFKSIGAPKGVFQDHFETNYWANTESVSGAGSTMEYTANIRKMIPQLVEELGKKVILDAPCGDYNWFKTIEWKTPITYTGGDIVKPLVKRNQALYGSEGRSFIDLDILNDPLPPADLWLCRDCLFHLSERDIFLALDNFLKSDITYLLTSNHADCDINYDIPTGSFRLLNLQLPPFGLGKPIRLIDDWIEGFPVRQLALWSRQSVKDALASNKAFQRTVGSRH